MNLIALMIPGLWTGYWLAWVIWELLHLPIKEPTLEDWLNE